jgi:hypothetical protein
MADRPVTSDESYSFNGAVPWWMLQDAPRVDARQEYDLVMGTRVERIAELRRLMARSGVFFDGSDRSLQEVNDWFVASMAPSDEGDFPDPRSLSISQDMALLLGEEMIARNPMLHWEFFTWGKRNVAYQCAVIMGFPHQDPKWHINVDPFGIVHGYGVVILENRRGLPVEIGAPAGHPLAGMTMEPPPMDPTKFVTWLNNVDERCGRER